jgi:parvulin-like peptidyl-prolyl isomerase
MRGKTLIRPCGLLLLALALLLVPAVRAQDTDVVTQVNGEPITRAMFHARVRFVRWQYIKELEKLFELTGGNLLLAPDHAETLFTNLKSPAVLGEAVLEQMEDELLLRQAGDEFGITVTDEAVAARERAFFSLWTGVPVDQLATSAEAQSFITLWYAEAASVSGLTEADLHAIFAAEVLRGELYVRVGQNVASEELAVNSRHILCSFHPDDLGNLSPPTEEQRAAAQACIRSVLDRLAVGESFEDVARDLSDDRASAQQGGNVGWTLLSYLAEGYANAVRDAELNTILGPVETEFGLHIIEVLDRRMQPLTDAEYDQSRQGYFRLWIDDLRAQATVERSDDWDAGLPVDPTLDALDANLLAALEGLEER